MPRFRPSRRRPRLLRILALALLVLGLVLQPVLAAVGEAHEFAHAASLGGNGHVDVGIADGHAAQAEEATGTDPAESGSTLHALLQFAHCCGQSVTLLPDRSPALLAAVRPAEPTPGVAVMPLHVRAPVMLRPPIR